MKKWITSALADGWAMETEERFKKSYSIPSRTRHVLSKSGLTAIVWIGGNSSLCNLHIIKNNQVYIIDQSSEYDWTEISLLVNSCPPQVESAPFGEALIELIHVHGALASTTKEYKVSVKIGGIEFRKPNSSAPTMIKEYRDLAKITGKFSWEPYIGKSLREAEDSFRSAEKALISAGYSVKKRTQHRTRTGQTIDTNGQVSREKDIN